MNKTLTIITLLVLAVPAAMALDISGVSINPNVEPWMTDTFNISATCSANSSYQMYVQNLTVYNDGSSWQNLSDDKLVFEDGVLHYSDLEPYLIKSSTYGYDIRCMTNGDEASYSNNFTVKQLDITNFDLNTTQYLGEEIRLAFNLESNPSGESITSDVDFTVSAEDQEIQIEEPTPFITGEQWIVNVTLPVEGSYDLTIQANHDGTTASTSKTVEVNNKSKVEAAVANSTVSGGDDVSLSINASYKGEPVSIGKDDIDLELEEESIEDEVTGSDSTFTISMPQKSPGIYDMTVSVDTGEVSGTEVLTVTYPVTIDGTFSTLDGGLLPYQILLWQDGVRVRDVSGSGDYELTVDPRDYGFEVIFPHPRLEATLDMDEIEVTSWDDPLQFERYTDLDGSVPGITTAGLYAFKTTLEPDTVVARFDYWTDRVEDPEDVTVYHCDQWNMEKGLCYGDWSDVYASFDRVDEWVEVYQADQGAYAIGARKELSLDYDISRSSARPDETVWISGSVQADSGVEDSTVTIAIPDAGIRKLSSTISDGSFNASLPLPSQDGEHSVTISAEKPPYRSAEGDATIEVVRPYNMSIDGPQEVSVQANDTATVHFSATNTGYRIIDRITPYVEDVSYVTDVSVPEDRLHINQTGVIALDLSIPAGEPADTYTMDPVFSTGDTNQTVTISLSIEQKNVTGRGENTSSPSSITGMLASDTSIPILGSVSDTVTSANTQRVIGGIASVGLLALFGLVIVKRLVGRSGVADTMERIKSSITDTGDVGTRNDSDDSSVVRQERMDKVEEIKQELDD